MPTTLTDCPSCGRKLRLPEEVLGKDVQCPSCRSTFQARALEAERGVTSVPTAQSEPAATPPEPVPPFAVPQLSLDDDDIPKVVPAALPAPPLPYRPVLLEAERTDPIPGDAVAWRSCPFCGEPVSQLAVRCRFCGEDLRQTSSHRRAIEAHRGGLVLALGIVGLVASIFAFFAIVGLPLSIIAWMMGNTDVQAMAARRMDPEGMGMTRTGKVLGILGTLIGAGWLVLFCCGSGMRL